MASVYHFGAGSDSMSFSVQDRPRDLLVVEIRRLEQCVDHQLKGIGEVLGLSHNKLSRDCRLLI